MELTTTELIEIAKERIEEYVSDGSLNEYNFNNVSLRSDMITDLFVELKRDFTVQRHKIYSIVNKLLNDMNERFVSTSPRFTSHDEMSKLYQKAVQQHYNIKDSVNIDEMKLIMQTPSNGIVQIQSVIVGDCSAVELNKETLTVNENTQSLISLLLSGNKELTNILKQMYVDKVKTKTTNYQQMFIKLRHATNEDELKALVLSLRSLIKQDDMNYTNVGGFTFSTLTEASHVVDLISIYYRLQWNDVTHRFDSLLDEDESDVDIFIDPSCLDDKYFEADYCRQEQSSVNSRQIPFSGINLLYCELVYIFNKLTNRTILPKWLDIIFDD